MSHEKEGGHRQEFMKMQGFRNLINNCGFVDMRFTGPKFTWCNKWDPQVCVWERLDHALANVEWIALYGKYKVHNLQTVGSNHRSFNFQFQPAWVRHESFLNQIENSSSEQCSGSPFHQFCHKIKTCKNDLKVWNKSVFGCIGTEINKGIAIIASLQSAHLPDQYEKRFTKALAY